MSQSGNDEVLHRFRRVTGVEGDLGESVAIKGDLCVFGRMRIHAHQANYQPLMISPL
jgi:hypothetical protein